MYLSINSKYAKVTFINVECFITLTHLFGAEMFLETTHYHISDLYKAPAQVLSDKVQQYDEILKALLDKHAPEITKKVAEKESRPWINDKIAAAKKRRRRAERRWHRTRLTVHREIYQAERKKVQDLLD